jgi:hypothetical protein
MPKNQAIVRKEKYSVRYRDKEEELKQDAENDKLATYYNGKEDKWDEEFCSWCLERKTLEEVEDLRLCKKCKVVWEKEQKELKELLTNVEVREDD